MRGCIPVKNTPVSRQVVAEIGLMARIMKTHGQRHILSSAMILHFFSVSYDHQWKDDKARRRDQHLEVYRRL